MGKPMADSCWCLIETNAKGREEGGGFRMGNTCIPVADSFWYLAKLIQLCKIKKKKKERKKPMQHCKAITLQFNSVQFSCSVMSDSLQPHGLQHARLHCPSPTPRAYSNSCPSSQWCHPTISSSIVLFSSCLQSFPASGSFPMSQFFESSSQSIGASASASVLPMNNQDWFPLGWTGWISLQSKGLSRVFSNTTVQNLNSGWCCHRHPSVKNKYIKKILKDKIQHFNTIKPIAVESI